VSPPVISAERRPRGNQTHQRSGINEQLALTADETRWADRVGGDGAAGVAGEPRPLTPIRDNGPTGELSRAGEQTALARLLLTPQEAAELLAVGRTTLYGLLQSGELTSVRIGACRRIPYDALRAFVDGLTSLRNNSVIDRR
jgi:excisionase family DNA binding protein